MIHQAYFKEYRIRLDGGGDRIQKTGIGSPRPLPKLSFSKKRNEPLSAPAACLRLGHLGTCRVPRTEGGTALGVRGRGRLVPHAARALPASPGRLFLEAVCGRRTPRQRAAPCLFHLVRRPSGPPSSGRARKTRGARVRAARACACVCVLRTRAPACVRWGRSAGALAHPAAARRRLFPAGSVWPCTCGTASRASVPGAAARRERPELKCSSAEGWKVWQLATVAVCVLSVVNAPGKIVETSGVGRAAGRERALGKRRSPSATRFFLPINRFPSKITKKSAA